MSRRIEKNSVQRGNASRFFCCIKLSQKFHKKVNGSGDLLCRFKIYKNVEYKTEIDYENRSTKTLEEGR